MVSLSSLYGPVCIIYYLSRKTQWPTIEIFSEASAGGEIIIRDDEDISPDLLILPPQADIRLEVSCPTATVPSAGTSSVTPPPHIL